MKEKCKNCEVIKELGAGECENVCQEEVISNEVIEIIKKRIPCNVTITKISKGKPYLSVCEVCSQLELSVEEIKDLLSILSLCGINLGLSDSGRRLQEKLTKYLEGLK